MIRDVMVNTRLPFPTFGIYRDMRDDMEGDFYRFAAECKDKVVYLASPYMSQMPYQPSGGVSKPLSNLRATQTTIVTDWLLDAGIWTFSPIVYGRGMERVVPEREKGWWMRRDAELFKKMDILAVLALTGWQDSPGVAEEIGWAVTTGKPVYILDPRGDWFDEKATAGSEFRKNILGAE